ncbi:MAG: DUF89 family protein [Elusimicrobia bacterium]|nr:DUF89 family protein [Elusimicrobiota bacterium]
MRTYLDCIPCFFRQVLESARLAGASERQRKEALDEFSKIIPGFSLEMTPAEMGRYIYKIVCDVVKNSDPYYSTKRKSTRLALELYPAVKRKVASSADRLAKAVEFAILGNIIDYGVKNRLDVDEELKKIMTGDGRRQPKRKFYRYAKFKKELEKAKMILYLADNAGETVFDRVLIEEIKTIYPDKKIVYAVKSKPIINDAVVEDAVEAGVDKVAKIVACGSDAPGTVLGLCTKKFLKIFDEADIIISKGQGNFESLNESKRRVFFLFRAKCEVVAKHVGCGLGEVVLISAAGDKEDK